jgi:predicted metallopeptidase
LTKKRTYVYSTELEKLLKDIVYTLRDFFPNIDIERVKVVVCKDCRSRALARIYALPSVWRFVLELPPIYVIEVIERNFDPLPPDEKVKVLIHELLHIPKSFSGGLRPHGRYVNSYIVEKLYREYVKRRKP